MAALAYNVQECAKALGCSSWLVYRLAADGTLPTIPHTRRVLIPKHALDRMLADPSVMA